MKKRLFWAVIIVIVVVLSVLFYFRATRPEAEAPDEIRIGAVLPLTGNTAFLGEGEKNGIEMAVADKNTELAQLGFSLRVLYGDSQGVPREGVSAANKFVSVDNVRMLLGSTTGVANALLPIVESSNGLLFAMTIAPFITERSPRVFRVWPSNELEREMQAGLIADRGWSRLGLLYVEADYGLEAKRALLEHLSPGTEIVYEEAYPLGTTEFRNILVGLRGAEVDALVLAGYPPEFISLVKQLREIPFDGTIIGDIGFTFQFVRDALGESGDGIVFTAPRYSFGTAGPHAEAFVSAYAAKFGKEPSWNEAYSYDLILVIAEGVERCRCGDPDGLAEAIRGIQDLDGVTGKVSILPNGDAVTEIGLAVLRDGEVVALGEQGGNTR